MSAPNLTGTHLIVQIKQSQNACVLRLGAASNDEVTS